MTAIWNNIVAWFESKGVTAHVLASVFLFLMGAYAAVPQFHSLVLQIHQSLPAWAQELVTTALALWAFYKTWKTTGSTPPKN